jgi:RimJ/RimL family protein N-acetyltransferase
MEVKIMNNVGTKTIETERLILRRIKLSDAEDVFAWANDNEVSRYVTWKPHKNMRVTKKYLLRCVLSYIRKDYYRWCIVLKETGRAIGTIGAHAENRRIKAIELGYVLLRSCWGKGIMTEAVKAVQDYLFDKAGYNRIAAKHAPENPASGKVMLKAGMQYEGIQRQGGKNNEGNLIDLACYAILKSDRV